MHCMPECIDIIDFLVDNKMQKQLSFEKLCKPSVYLGVMQDLIDFNWCSRIITLLKDF